MTIGEIKQINNELPEIQVAFEFEYPIELFNQCDYIATEYLKAVGKSFNELEQEEMNKLVELLVNYLKQAKFTRRGFISKGYLEKVKIVRGLLRTRRREGVPITEALDKVIEGLYIKEVQKENKIVEL